MNQDTVNSKSDDSESLKSEITDDRKPISKVNQLDGQTDIFDFI
ncbi:hypothetical protein lbkm_0658 [Lachnospiraceae bacterium KM106-2]|nr:hypothetical protein lbkm_0658 [Lachnospiraceae bacterium KM106-2]